MDTIVRGTQFTWDKTDLAMVGKTESGILFSYKTGIQVPVNISDPVDRERQYNEIIEAWSPKKINERSVLLYKEGLDARLQNPQYYDNAIDGITVLGKYPSNSIEHHFWVMGFMDAVTFGYKKQSGAMSYTEGSEL